MDRGENVNGVKIELKCGMKALMRITDYSIRIRKMIFPLGMLVVLFGFTGDCRSMAGYSLQNPEKTNRENLRNQTEIQVAVHQDSSEADSSKNIGMQLTIPHRVENKAFAVGEHLVFEIAYKFIKAGTATMSIPDTQWVHGRPCYHIVTTARSNKFFDTFFKVRDRVETFIDMEGLFPWKFEKRIREGKYRTHRTVEYDQLNQRVIYNKKDTLAVPPFVQGVLSSFYYVRVLPLEVGKSWDIDNYGDGKMYPLKVLVHKKQKVEVPAGTFNCIVVEPVIKGKGIFNQKGRMAIWLTDDERRIPVLMKSKVAIGSIDVRLKSMKTKVK